MMTDRIPRRRLPAGFTLVEVVLALLVGSLVALLANQIFRAAVGARQLLVTVNLDNDTRAQGRRWLSSAFRSARVGPGATFEGHRSEVVFTTSMPVAAGWFEPARVGLSVGRPGLQLTGGPAGVVQLDGTATALHLDYLLELGADAPWAAEWVSPVSVPTAVRLRIERAASAGIEVDTLLFLLQGGP